MPNWNQVLQEIASQAANAQNRQDVSIAIDNVRKKYLDLLFQKTGRNVIAYYSGWLQKPGFLAAQLNDDDKNGFMMAVHTLECHKGLDLILHTPGGDIAATESIIDYLYQKFKNTNGDIDIRIIVPQLAMSAGTMIACSGCSILMGRQSNLGPIDPHLSNIPAHGVIAEFKRAYKEIKKDPAMISVWQFILQKYNPTFLSACENAIALSEEFIQKNLMSVMFKGERDAKKKAKAVVKYLTAYTDRKSHGRHITVDECKSIKLKVTALEDDQDLQDLVLTVHHCYMHTLSNTDAIKVIENHKGVAMMRLLS